MIVPQRLGPEDQGARRGGPRDGAVRMGPGRRHGSFRDFRGDEAGRRGVFRFDRQPVRGGDGVPRPGGGPNPGEGTVRAVNGVALLV